MVYRMSKGQKKVPRARRVFSAEFKASAARLVTHEGRTVSEVSRELDVVPSALMRWVAQAAVDAGSGPEGALSSAERSELVALRRRVRQAEMERDILKKATAFFAKENG